MIQLTAHTVISHLSVGEHAMDEDGFQRTMRYIFTFIEKEKQAESIVEKLCQRFRLTEDARQWRDIAFCLSLLPFKSERSVKKLIEGLPFYRDKLHNKEVYSRFQEILVKVRRALMSLAGFHLTLTNKLTHIPSPPPFSIIKLNNRHAQTKPRTNPTLS